MKLKSLYSPTVFVADDLTSYGIKKPTFIRSIIVWLGQHSPSFLGLYRPATTEIELTDCLWLRTLPVVTDQNKQDYLNERAAVLQALVDKIGWRRIFISSCVEMPNPECRKDPESVTGRVLRMTKFNVY